VPVLAPPPQLGRHIFVSPRQTTPSAGASDRIHLLDGLALLARAMEAPFSSPHILSLRLPFVTFGAAPAHLRSQVLVFRREAHAAEFLCSFPHLFEREAFSSQPLQSPISLGKRSMRFLRHHLSRCTRPAPDDCPVSYFSDPDLRRSAEHRSSSAAASDTV
jgi:hypothetical protein